MLPPPGDAVTVYVWIALPPLDAGAVHDTRAIPSTPLATTPVAAPGGPTGVHGAASV